MTEVTLDGAIAPRTTQWSRYPLPPEIPGRFKPEYNRYGQYQLPHPSTGRPSAFSRATTIAAVLDDTYALDMWIQRKIITAVLNGVRAQMKLSAGGGLDESETEVVAAMERLWATPPNTQKFNGAIDVVDNLQGGRDASEFGTAIHAWLEAIDCGIVRPQDVPELFRTHVEVYRELLKRHALLPVPEYTERIVCNDNNGFEVPTELDNGGEILSGPRRALSPGETITGTLDRLFRVITTGDLVLGDVKTSKADSLEWGVLEFAIQLAIYRYATYMLKLDGSGWDPMPALIGDTAYLMHVPSDDPQRAACLALNVGFGSEALHIAVYVRDLRRRAKREGLVGTIPVPSPEALQWAEARHAIQDVQDPADLAEIWTSYQSVWTDELTALGQQIAGLFTTQGVSA